MTHRYNGNTIGNHRHMFIKTPSMSSSVDLAVPIWEMIGISESEYNIRFNMPIETLVEEEVMEENKPTETIEETKEIEENMNEIVEEVEQIVEEIKEIVEEVKDDDEVDLASIEPT